MRNSVGVLGVLLCGLVLSSTAHATLFSRLGGAAAYDDVLDITWLTDASALGTGTWQEQVDAAAALDTLGFDDWRLASISATSPTTSVSNCSSGTAADCANAGNELGYMYYHNMDGSGNNTGTQIVDGISLTDVQSNYWSGTEFNSIRAWNFLFGLGRQFNDGKDLNLSGWAVRSGDVVGVPEPGTMLLMAASLGLFGFRRSQRRL